MNKEKRSSQQPLSQSDAQEASNQVSETPSKKRELPLFAARLVAVIAILMSAYHLVVAYRGTPEWLFHRSTHVMFAMVLGFLIYKGTRKDRRLTFAVDCVLAAASFGIWAYLMANYERFVTHFYMVDSLYPMDYIVAVALFVMVIELTRRTTGWALICVSGFFILHTIFSRYFPGFLRGAGTPIKTYLEYMLFTSDGLYGSSVNTSASYVFLFVLFGAFLEDTGVGDYFMGLATEFTKHLRGGPAKCAILASGMFGSISGSAVANVYATGVFTIPLMKREGFHPHFAGACEAVASSGGAIMPPVMGSAAFLMADFVGVPYALIAKCAIIPAILYYLSLWCFVDMEAQKMGMKKKGTGLRINAAFYLKHCYLMLPILVIIGLLLLGYSAFMAAFYATLSTLVVGAVKSLSSIRPDHILRTLAKAGTQSVTIAVPLTCASIVVGSLNLTGIGLRLTSLIVRVAGGHLPIALLCTMIVTIILGMGLPTPAAYLIVAIFAPNAITSYGVPVLTAHMFCFYYAAFSTITPPVAMAAYAGGMLAGAPVNKTGFTAMKLGTAAYLIPWIFVYSEALFLNGTAAEILLAVCTALVGIYGLSAGMQGLFLGRKVHPAQRGLLLASAVCMIVPGLLSDAVGFAMMALVYFLLKSRQRMAAV